MNIGVFGTFGRKTLAIMLICIGDGIRDSLIIDVIAGYGVCRTRTFIRGLDLTFLLQLLPYTYD